MTATVFTPLRSEWLALRDRVRTPDLVRSGRATGESRPGSVLVAGVAGALRDDLLPGDLVVATEVWRGEDPSTDPGARIICPAAPIVAGDLRRIGLLVHTGPIVTVDGVVHDPDRRRRLADTGALAVDTESAGLVSTDGTTVVVRAVVDTPDRPLLRPGTPARGVAALASLRRAAPVIEAWAAATGERELLLAGPRSFCAGVERAIEIVERALERFGAPVYVRRQIVHNRHVVDDLERRGAVFVEEADDVPPGSTLVLAAHGVAPEVRSTAAERELKVIDATCPLVSKVHAQGRHYVRQGRTVILIGHAGHPEVEGTLGQIPGKVLLVQTEADVAKLDLPADTPLAYVTQTTLSVDDTRGIIAALYRRFKDVNGPGTKDICYATQNRQTALLELSKLVDVIFVVGATNSSNSNRLCEIGIEAGTPTHLIANGSEIKPEWLTGVEVVGITAGASAPEVMVKDVIDTLRRMAPVELSTLPGEDEHIEFRVPLELLDVTGADKISKDGELGHTSHSETVGW